MVAGPERAQLLPAPLERAGRNGAGIGPGQPAGFLDTLQIRPLSEPAPHGPRRAILEYRAHLGGIEREVVSPRTNAGRHVLVHLRDDRAQSRQDVLSAQT